MKVLITGARGMIGRRLAAAFGMSNRVTAAGHGELDITDRNWVQKFVRESKPDLIINCAVIGVDECERNPTKARKVNVVGPRNLAEAAGDIDAAIVHFSTNYVFDGGRTEGSYSIGDEPCPVNEYGRTKWHGEQAVAAACNRSFILRTSWVYGGGKNSFFDNAVVALCDGRHFEAVNDNWANTTYVEDLVKRTIEIHQRGRPGTYHVVNEGVCSRYDFAVEAAGILGAGTDRIVPVGLSNSCYLAARPRYTPMVCRLSQEIGMKPMRNWRLALSEFIEWKRSKNLAKRSTGDSS